MAIAFQCPACGRRGRTDEKLAGRIAKCPACSQSFEIPTLGASPPSPSPAADEPGEGIDFSPQPPALHVEAPPVQSLSDDASSRPTEQTPADRLRNARVAWSLVFIFAGVVFLATLRQEFFLPNYLCLMLTLFSVRQFIRSYWPRRAALITTVIAILVATAVFWQFDYYVHSWHETDEATGERSYYTDSYWRAGGWKFHRHVHISGGELGLAFYDFNYSESGSSHGKAKYSVWPTEDDTKGLGRALKLQGYEKQGRIYTLTEWYWYGDKVSEGEWHLRNKR